VTANLEGLRRAGRRVLPFPLFRRLSEGYNFAAGASRLGPSQYRALHALGLGRCRKDLANPIEFRIPTLLQPISVRPGTTDAESLIHTVVRKTYGRYLPEGPVHFIIDAGANIGDTASWYLSRYPDARVAALEPDSANFEMLQRNCAPYGPRAILLKRGVWSRAAYLKVLGDGHMESGLFVVETPLEKEADCIGMSPLDILTASRESVIDIFKCDIEGAEREVFGGGSDEWLSRTRSIFIEIHNREAHEIVMAATRRHSFSSRTYRELYIFHKLGCSTAL
jgi:FkbM family methyltransferase